MDERAEVLKRLKEAVDIFTNNERSYLLIPEIRTNFGYALRGAKTTEDVAAIPGRLTVAFNRVIYCLPPAFGASDHIARVIITAMKHEEEKRSAINLKYYEEIARNLPQDDTYIFDRKQEPEESRKMEHHTMNFMVEMAYKKFGKIPQYIVDLGDLGKEPTIYVIDKDPVIVAEKSLKLLNFLSP
jgi:predicted fused transcriptional regulator/phosphomethylpyrimidine kinase